MIFFLKVSFILASYDTAQLGLSLAENGQVFRPDNLLSSLNIPNPLFICINQIHPNPRKKTRLEAIKLYTFNPSIYCVTTYSKRRLATFAHLMRKDVYKDPSVKVTI